MILGIISLLLLIGGFCLALYKAENDNLYWTGWLLTMIGATGVAFFITVNIDIILSWFKI